MKTIGIRSTQREPQRQNVDRGQLKYEWKMSAEQHFFSLFLHEGTQGDTKSSVPKREITPCCQESLKMLLQHVLTFSFFLKVV